MRNQRGFMLAMVLMIVSIVILLAITRHFFSRQQLTVASHQAKYEQAYHLSLGALEAADSYFLQSISFLNDSNEKTFPKSKRASKEMSKFVEQLLDKDEFISFTDKTISFDSSLFSKLEQKIEKSTVKVNLEIKDVGPVNTSPKSGGIQADSRERKLLLIIHAEAEVDSTIARVVRYREARYVSILPSVLGKFVLFLREQGNLDINSFQDSDDTNKLQDSPLVVYSGQYSKNKILSSSQISKFFDNQGWIFLGGINEWKIGLGKGGQNANIASALLKPTTYLFNLPPEHMLSTTGIHMYYSQQRPLFRELKNEDYYEVFAKLNNPKAYTSSRIRLSGSEQLPSPTLIIGNVSRNWALLQGIKQTKSGDWAPLPYLSSADFTSLDWPGGINSQNIKKLQQNFNGDYSQYAAQMSQVVEEDFNSGNISIVKFSKKSLANRLILDLNQLPIGTTLPKPSELLKVDSVPASFFTMAYGSAYEIHSNDGQTLFSHADLSRFEDLNFLIAKSSDPFFSEKEFYKQYLNKKQKVIINDIYYIKNKLTISKPFYADSGCGGIIIADGDINIEESIETAANETITIISLNGDINIRTSQTINAGLIAIKGVISTGHSFGINGLIAGKSLSMPISKPVNTRKLTYNTNFDITNSTTYKRSFKLFFPEKGVTFVR